MEKVVLGFVPTPLIGVTMASVHQFAVDVELQLLASAVADAHQGWRKCELRSN